MVYCMFTLRNLPLIILLYKFLICSFRETDEKTSQGQRDAGRRLGERITDTTFWRNEVKTELEKLITEIELFQNARRAVEKAILDIEGPLHIAQECLYLRENRPGTLCSY